MPTKSSTPSDAVHHCAPLRQACPLCSFLHYKPWLGVTTGLSDDLRPEQITWQDIRLSNRSIPGRSGAAVPSSHKARTAKRTCLPMRRAEAPQPFRAGLGDGRWNIVKTERTTNSQRVGKLQHEEERRGVIPLLQARIPFKRRISLLNHTHSIYDAAQRRQRNILQHLRK